jgi:ElaB/YqjD/DUF883 family membrane-anchored ribosome-binding protein
MTRSTNGSHRAGAEHRDDDPKTSPNEIFTFTDLDLSAAEDYVRRKPQNALLMAFAAGFVASILLRRK